MAATSQFANRYKKDFSTEALRTKVARRKSIHQKENRHKLFEKRRQLGLADVNVQLSKERGISELKEARELCPQENSSVKQKATPNAATKRMNERKEMLQRYKEEKELRKLQEQRERAKKGVFKVGLYRPAAPGFLAAEEPAVAKPRETAAPAFSGRMTRSKAKMQEGKSMIPTLIPTASKSSTVSAHGQSVRSTQAGHKQMSKAKVAEKEKVLQTAAQPAPSGRVTRAAASAARQVLKPTAATAGNQSQRKAANVGKQKKAVKPDPIKIISSEHEVETNSGVDPGVQSSAADSTHSVPVKLQQEQTSVENNNFCPRRPRTRSFAPQNFVFQPPNELATYTVTPMSPSRANAFLTPTAVWNFSKSPVKIFEKSSETKAQKPNLKIQISPSVEGIQEQQMTTSLKRGAGESDGRTSTQRSNKTTPVSTALAVKADDTREQEHDVPYFRNILRTETERLLSQCLQWEGNLELDIPEDAKDLIRSTVGQTRLLIGERFKQFEGLVDNCEFKRGEKETTCTDLDGFWDMVNFQIEDVNKKFDNLVKLQDNEWKPLDVPSKAVVKKKAVPSGVAKAKVEAAARAAARSRLAFVKAAMRDRMKQGGAAEGTQQESLPEAEKVVFEAGFFRIESPVKNFSGLIPRTPGKLANPRSSRSLLSSPLCNPEDAPAKKTPSALKGFHPAQSLKMDQLPTEQTPPLDELPEGLEQSTSVVAEELCLVAGPAEGNKVLGNPGSESKAVDGMEELELSAAEQGQDIIMCSPGETNSAQSGEPQIHQTDVSCSDLALIDRNPFDMPVLDAELPFTPVKTRAQNLAAAEVFGDLMVFSPVGPSGDH
ncbi:disks large-associated protein 5 isoform X2 [Passer montanus]|uniref:disks large-associated protein 5 isoform X2 n=1 Tax=Passer montanus TaxID=9160 RepID=UPI00196095CD|nr:disks large-associated protein 5 isoform X2 [Passer montanus]XP_039568859.1 disks large-associated protein 5 isoform X2 [Passer montanus]